MGAIEKIGILKEQITDIIERLYTGHYELNIKTFTYKSGEIKVTLTGRFDSIQLKKKEFRYLPDTQNIDDLKSWCFDILDMIVNVL